VSQVTVATTRGDPSANRHRAEARSQRTVPSLARKLPLRVFNVTTDLHRATGPAGVVHAIEWRDVCPWYILFRVPAVTVSGSVLVLSLLGCWTSLILWSLLSAALGPGANGAETLQHLRRAETSLLPQTGIGLTVGSGQAQEEQSATSIRERLIGDHNPVVYAGTRMVLPLVTILRDRPTFDWIGIFYCLIGALINIVNWGFWGTAICRIAVTEIGSEQRVGPIQALRFSGNRIAALTLAPILPLSGVILFALPVVALGVLMRMDVGVLLAGFLWIVSLPLGLIVAILVLGLFLGWPFIWAAIAAEGKDVFDAVSRSYSYALQRPFQFAFYLTIVLILGGVTWSLALFFAHSVVSVTGEAAAWGAGASRSFEVWQAVEGRTETGSTSESLLSFPFRSGITFIRGTQWLVDLCAYSIAYGYFWCAVGCTYLLLRHDVDQKEIDELDWEEPPMVPPWELPPHVHLPAKKMKEDNPVSEPQPSTPEEST